MFDFVVNLGVFFGSLAVVLHLFQPKKNKQFDALKNSSPPIERIPLSDGRVLVGPKKELGTGTFGTVESYTLITPAGSHIEVAVKKPNDMLGEELQKRELSMLSKAGTHPNIIESLGSVRVKHDTWFIMKLMQGTLANLLAKDLYLSLSIKLDIAIQIMRGLAHLHKLSTTTFTHKAIVHQDLKLDNILYLIDLESPQPIKIKIADFGVSREVEQVTLSVFGSIVAKKDDGAFGGTAEYLAPEVVEHELKHKNSCDPKSDVFSAGLILWEIITGAPLIRSRQEILDGRCHGFEADKKSYKAQKNAGLRSGLFIQDSYPRSSIFGPTINKCLKKSLSSRCTAQEALELLEKQQAII